MKKALFIVLVLLGIAATIWLSIFYWKNLRGIGPALKAPEQDIAQLIEQAGAASGEAAMPLALPPGFSISIFAKGLEKPRVMALDPAVNLLVSIPSQGRVVALPDQDGDGKADKIVTVIDGLKRPHGLAFRCAPECKLYIAEENQVAVYDYDRDSLKASNKEKIVDLPSGGFHVTRTLLFLPKPDDDKLLISVGSSCNACNEDDWRRAKVLVLDPKTGSLKTFASGLRNAVFMTVYPKKKKIWVTEMGRDLLGDDLPPDEINIIEQGRDYGWPLCYGKNVHDFDFDRKLYEVNPCDSRGMMPSCIDISAHSAPLGLAFFPVEGWPVEFRNDLLVAYHGSWNRSIPTGYKIVRYKLDAAGKYLGVKDFATGWLTNDGKALGRPVDIMIRPNGIIFVSDDKAGVIYRMVGWSGKEWTRRDGNYCIFSSSPTIPHAMAMQTGRVNTQARTILPAMPHRTAESRLVAPTPRIAVETTWVVLTGRPKWLVATMMAAEDVSAAKP
jgi:glucose/arabinose dehydrogenase